MKNAILILLAALSSLHMAAQEITEENYLHADSMLWVGYENRLKEMQEEWQAHPEKADSIQAVFDKMLEATLAENARLAVEYASVPSGLQRCYMVRLDLPKDTLRAVLSRIPADMRESDYGKYIERHIAARQLEEGDSLLEFPVVDETGAAFDWRQAAGKSLLLLYGGMDCMGESGREYLAGLYERSSRADFLIVVYWPVSSLENLQKIKEKYPCEYAFVSDFLQNGSPIKIEYGSQATPTCYFFGPNGTLKARSVGLVGELRKQIESSLGL